MSEVIKAFQIIKKYNQDINISLLHCTSLYLAPNETLNLNAIFTLLKKFKCAVGYSDHSIGNYASIAAVALGAKIIEKHFTLNKKFSDPDQSASANPKELTNLIKDIRNLETALGNGKKTPHDAEKNTADVARRSWHANNKIYANTKINSKDLILLRPGTGIQSNNIISGLKSNIDIKKGQKIKINWLYK